MGVALIDVGRGSTTVSVFAEGTLIGTNVTPLGGDNVTKDLSIGLRTTTEDAEDIKLKHGHAFYDTANEEETRSEERRVGKECRSRRGTYHVKRKDKQKQAN